MRTINFEAGTEMPAENYYWLQYNREGRFEPYETPDLIDTNRIQRKFIEPLLRNNTDQVIEELDAASAIEDFDDTRLKHYFNALEIPYRPLVVLKDGQHPVVHEIFKKHDVHIPSSNTAGYNDPQLRLSFVDANLCQNTDTIEEVAAHEHTHASGMLSRGLHISPQRDLSLLPFGRFGFCVFPDIVAAPDPEERNTQRKGLSYEEATAEINASCFRTEVLGVKDEPISVGSSEGKWKLPGRYLASNNTLTDGHIPAHVMELLAIQNPEIISDLYASRTTVGGLRRFIQAVEGASKGLYTALRDAPADEWTGRSTAMLAKVVDTLFEGDRSVLQQTGGAAKTYVSEKLAAYEAETGYNFKQARYER